MSQKKSSYRLAVALALAVIGLWWLAPRPAAALESGQGCCICEGTEKSKWTNTKEDECGKTCQPQTYKFFMGLACNSPELEKTLNPANAKPGATPSVPAGAPQTITLKNPLGTTEIPVLIGRVIRALLGVSGSLALLMFIYGGFVWITSGGIPDRIILGKNTMVWAALGLALIFSAYAVLFYFFQTLSA